MPKMITNDVSPHLCSFWPDHHIHSGCICVVERFVVPKSILEAVLDSLRMTPKEILGWYFSDNVVFSAICIERFSARPRLAGHAHNTFNVKFIVLRILLLCPVNVSRKLKSAIDIKSAIDRQIMHRGYHQPFCRPINRCRPQLPRRKSTITTSYQQHHPFPVLCQANVKDVLLNIMELNHRHNCSLSKWQYWTKRAKNRQASYLVCDTRRECTSSLRKNWFPFAHGQT